MLNLNDILVEARIASHIVDSHYQSVFEDYIYFKSCHDFLSRGRQWQKREFFKALKKDPYGPYVTFDEGCPSKEIII